MTETDCPSTMTQAERQAVIAGLLAKAYLRRVLRKESQKELALPPPAEAPCSLVDVKEKESQ